MTLREIFISHHEHPDQWMAMRSMSMPLSTSEEITSATFHPHQQCPSKNCTITETQNSHVRRNIISSAIGNALSYCCGTVSQTDLGTITTNDEEVQQFMSRITNATTSDRQTIMVMQNERDSLAQQVNDTFHRIKNEIDTVIND